jgi:hypothetical protein
MNTTAQEKIVVARQIVQEVNVEFPIPSFWKEAGFTSPTFWGFLSPEAVVKTSTGPYYTGTSVFKPDVTDMKLAVSKFDQITEQEFWNYYNDAKRRIESFETTTA